MGSAEVTEILASGQHNPDTNIPAPNISTNTYQKVRALLNHFNLGYPAAVGALTTTIALRSAPALAEDYSRAQESQTDDQHIDVLIPQDPSDSPKPELNTPPLGPDDDYAFYNPNELPAENGKIIWYRPSEFRPLLGRKANAKAWQLVYKSSSATGEPVAVSGTVLAPAEGIKPDTPLVSFASGTQGMADRCAASKLLEDGLDYEGPVIQLLLKRGWAVVITDYQGLGTAGDHPYVVGQALGRNVLDAARAALQLPELGLSPDTKVGVWGYSEGGAAAAWAGQLQPDYAPNMNLVAVAAGGIPADLTAVAKYVDKGPFSGLQMMAAEGFDEAYQLDLNSDLSAEGARRRDIVRMSCLFDGLIQTAFTSASRLTTTDIFKSPKWVARLSENKLGRMRIKVPVLMYHGMIDEAVPFKPAEKLFKLYCQMGMKVKWTPHVLSEHIITLYAGSGQAVQFLASNFAGSPIPSDCNRRRPWPW